MKSETMITVITCFVITIIFLDHSFDKYIAHKERMADKKTSIELDMHDNDYIGVGTSLPRRWR